MQPARFVYAAFILALSISGPAGAAGVQGMSLHGQPKYAPDFKNFEFANPDAPKGGALVLGADGSFDSLNPFAVKGVAPVLVSSLMFQELGDSPLDEAFTKYPTLAESFKLADDKLSMDVKLNKDARFSDGKPVTADDLIFTFKMLMSEKAPPFYRFYYADIKELKKVDELSVKMIFAKVNPELPLIAAELPVLPKHVYEKGDFGTDFATKAVGSGPYLIKEFKMGSHIIMTRNPKFWGKDHPVFKGRFNFDEIHMKYFKDSTATVESFKKGDFDFYTVYSSKVWAKDLTGDRFETMKWIKKAMWEHKNNEGAQGFMFNLRKPMFSDVRVRKAVAMAFDFDWSNKNIFFDQYVQNSSFFENSPLKATGLPTAEEKKILEPLKADLPAEVFTEEMGYIYKEKDIKKRLRSAMLLLKDAGYVIKDGVAVGPAGKLDFKFLLDSAGMAKIVEPFAQNLKKIGIVSAIEEKEQSVYVKRIESREFDAIVQSVGQSQSPGNEQKEFWGSEAADQNHSRNYAGVKNKAIDALVDRIIYAKDREELVLYTKCLDRALYHLHLQVHNWHIGTHRVAFWDKFGTSDKVPPFYAVRQLQEYMWFDATKAKKLEDAKSKGTPLL